MPTYDSNQFDPPAPLARVSLRVPEGEKAVTDVPMLIDSGADLTLIPEGSVADLKLELDRVPPMSWRDLTAKRPWPGHFNLSWYF